MQRSMRSLHLTLISLVVLLTGSIGCDVDELDSFDDAAEDYRTGSAKPPRSQFPVGSLWGRCDLSNVEDEDWWGCNGSLGEGLACFRPVSDNGLNICGPQTWDPDIADDCSNVYAPFGLGVRLQGSAYCVVDCVDDSDCAPGMGCAPASNFCAWIGE